MRRISPAVALVLVLSAAAHADFIDLPSAYSQTPWDYYGSPFISDSAAGWILCDDFTVTTRWPVEAVRWWGSHLNDQLDTSRPDEPGFIEPFNVAFYASVLPDGQTHPDSRPGPLACLVEVLAQRVFVEVDDLHYAVYRYDAYLPEDNLFDAWAAAYPASPAPGQVAGQLFLSIDKPDDNAWAWHEVEGPHPILDYVGWLDADRQTYRGDFPSDMAFEILVPEPASLALLAAGSLLLAARRPRCGRCHGPAGVDTGPPAPNEAGHATPGRDR